MLLGNCRVKIVATEQKQDNINHMNEGDISFPCEEGSEGLSCLQLLLSPTALSLSSHGGEIGMN